MAIRAPDGANKCHSTILQIYCPWQWYRSAPDILFRKHTGEWISSQIDETVRQKLGSSFRKHNLTPDHNKPGQDDNASDVPGNAKNCYEGLSNPFQHNAAKGFSKEILTRCTPDSDQPLKLSWRGHRAHIGEVGVLGQRVIVETDIALLEFRLRTLNHHSL